MKKPLIVTVAIVALLLCGGGAWYLLREPELPADVKVFVDGKEVSTKEIKDIKLPGGGSWSSEKAVIDPRAHMKEMLDGYFSLPEGPQRTRHLDELIDQQEKVRKEMNITTDAEGRPQIRMAGAPPTQPAGGEGQTERKTVVVRAGGAAADSMPPELSAKMAELVSAINKRRAERGLPPAQGLMMIRRKDG